MTTAPPGSLDLLQRPRTVSPIEETVQLAGLANAYLADPARRIEATVLYRRLTNEAPILDTGRLWLISGHTEINDLMRDPRCSSKPEFNGTTVPLSRLSAISDALALMLPMQSGQDHLRLRHLAMGAFSTRRLERLRDDLRAVLADLMAAPFERRSFEVVEELSKPLPLALTFTLLNIPRSDWAQLESWATVVIAAITDFAATDDSLTIVETQFAEFSAYLDVLAAERRARPSDDLVSHLVAAVDRDELSAAELQSFLIMLFVNGLETLTSGITSAIWELTQRPQLLVELHRDPTLSAAVFDECIRLATPVRATARLASEPILLADGRTVPAGAVLVFLFSAANHDERHYSNADQFEIHRNGRHLGFGAGPHRCLGAPLSLIAGGLALELIAAKFQRIDTALSPADAPWSPSLAFNTLTKLPVTLHEH